MIRRRELLLLCAAGLASRLLTLPGYVQDKDGYYFVHGVERYAMAELRPHFPGYPVYIWSAKLLAFAAGEAVLGLRLVSVLASVLCLWPVARLAEAWRRSTGGSEAEARRAGIAAALLWLLAPLPWLIGTELYSDAPGLLLALWMLLLCWRALAHPEGAAGSLTWAGALGGLLLGVRLAYVTLLLPLVVAFWRSRRAPHQTARALAAFLGCVALWLGWQVFREGGRLFESGAANLPVHFSEPGHTLATDVRSSTRPLRLVRNVAVFGLGLWWPGAPPTRLPATLLVAGLVAAGLWRLRRGGPSPPRRLPWLWLVPYVLGLLLAFGVDTLRYALPLVAVTCLLAGLGLPSPRRLAAALLVAVVLAIAPVSVPIAREHRETPPVASQLARFLRRAAPAGGLLIVEPGDPAALGLFLANEGPPLTLLPLESPTVPRWIAETEARGLGVYATAPPARQPEEWVAVARFCRSRWLESEGAAELWLFRHDPAAHAAAGSPVCQSPTGP